MDSRGYSILVAPLRRDYWPRDVLGLYKLPPVLSATPVHRYDPRNREDDYNFGRVRYFYDLIRSGGEIDPVELVSNGKRCWVDDGHHRYAAYVLSGVERMSVTVRGKSLPPRYKPIEETMIAAPFANSLLLASICDTNPELLLAALPEGVIEITQWDDGCGVNVVYLTTAQDSIKPFGEITVEFEGEFVRIGYTVEFRPWQFKAL